MANIDGVNAPVLNDTDYVDKILNSFEAVDDHDHSANKGLPIGVGGISAGVVTEANLAVVLANASKFLLRDVTGAVVSNTKAVPAGVVVGTTDSQTLTNKVLSGNTAATLISGSGTLTLNTTGTVTVPNATDTLVGKATTDTLTNKTLSGNIAATLLSGSGTLTLNTTGTITIPNATDTLVARTTTDTLTNKTLTAPSMTSATITSGALTLAEEATPSTPSSGFGRIYFKSDGFLYQLNDDGTETKVGAGNSGINYITNPDAESNTTGWATYADAAASRPVDGTGGSPNVTFTRSTSSPLRGTANFLFTKDAANRQGQGVSFDFTIASADQAKVLQIGFDYEIGSGTYSGGTSSTDSDLIVYIYRTTATARLIEPTPIKIDGAVIGQKYQFRGEFQTDSDATGYRLIIHVATTSASAYTVKMDNFSVVPVVYSIGAVATDFVTYIPTLNSATNVSSSPARWRRVGDSMEIRGEIKYSGAGNNSQLTFTIPSGYVIDSTKLDTTASTTTLGYWGWYDDAGASAGLRNGSVTLVDTSTMSFRIDGSAAQLNSNSFAANDVFGFYVCLPIVGWASTVTISSETTSRIVQMAVKAAVPTGGTNGGTATIIGGTPDEDTHGSYNSTTGVYTIPVSGKYRINGNIFVSGTSASPNRTLLQIFKNGSVLANGPLTRHTSALASDWTVGATTTRDFKAGDTVDIRLNTNITSPVFTSGDTSSNFFEVTRVSGPSQIAASETTAARWARTSAQSIGTGSDTKIQFATKVFDTHNAFDGVTNFRYTAPSTGIYSMSCTAAINAAASGTSSFITFYKNGVAQIQGPIFKAGASGTQGSIHTQMLNLVSGDYIEAFFQHNDGSNKNTTAELNIARLGP